MKLGSFFYQIHVEYEGSVMGWHRRTRGVSWEGSLGGECHGVPGVAGGECHGRRASQEGSVILMILGPHRSGALC